MNDIIAQITLNLAKKIEERFRNAEFTNLDLLCSDVNEDCRQAARNLVSEFLKMLNQTIRDNKVERKQAGIRLKDKDRPRTIYTLLGDISYSRDYYIDNNKHPVTVLDKVIGVEKYQRVDDTVKSKLVTEATRESYNRSSMIVSSGDLSRQTVRNSILEMQTLATVKPNETNSHKKVQELHVFADEDHVHLQKPSKRKGKKSQIVPVVVVTEGIRRIGNRGYTQAATRFVDKKFSGTALWKEVEGYINEEYDTDVLKKIWVHGDGGNWIKNGLEGMAEAEHVMDGYHFEKELKKVNELDKSFGLREKFNKEIKKEDQVAIWKLLTEYEANINDKTKENSVNEFKTYVLNNWESILNRKTNEITGSCTEGLVSHILSERFSRNPMGWSKESLGNLSCARVYVLNGGKITRENFRNRKENKSYASIYENKIKKTYEGKHDWSIFEQMPPIFDGNSGTMHMLKGFGLR